MEKSSIAPEKMAPQKETSVPSINFQGLIFREGRWSSIDDLTGFAIITRNNRKKLEKPWITKGLATWQSLGLILSCTGWCLWWTPKIVGWKFSWKSVISWIVAAWCVRTIHRTNRGKSRNGHTWILRDRGKPTIGEIFTYRFFLPIKDL